MRKMLERADDGANFAAEHANASRLITSALRRWRRSPRPKARRLALLSATWTLNAVAGTEAMGIFMLTLDAFMGHIRAEASALPPWRLHVQC